jgi:imidazolonepropionase-like amidohydrolase
MVLPIFSRPVPKSSVLPGAPPIFYFQLKYLLPLQQKLINLHEAGLTNLQILQTATINPAKFLYKEDQLGTVSVGKLADLLILDENPLTDITNTQKIYAVILNGKYFSKEDIRQMLEVQKKR